ncbi:MAG: hypothetical protein JNN07_28825 [Verrucomicrobiales bacterium]|nr:hypothetical protein [Verrucomicrobiales bacterium]
MSSKSSAISASPEHSGQLDPAGRLSSFRAWIAQNHTFLTAAASLVTSRESIYEDSAHENYHPRLRAPVDDFTLRDEANALTAFAFRNGYIEELHAGKALPLDYLTGFSRISDMEMKRLMIEASKRIAEFLGMRMSEPEKYNAFVRRYNQDYCRGWKRY